MREKLIELIHNAFQPCEMYKAMIIANFLIANGVTIQKWIPVSERLPEEDVRVLVRLAEGANAYTMTDTDRRHYDHWVRWGRYVTHWMPLPPTPKGE